MAQAYVPIATVTVGAAGATSIDFTNIPQTYTDLVVVFSSRAGSGVASNDSRMTFNGSSSGYSSKLQYGSGAISGSGSNSGSYLYWMGGAVAGGLTSNVFSNCELYIPNYTSSNNKSVLATFVTENNASFGTSGITSALWSNTAAITSISLTTDYNSYAQYTTATLYGIGGARASGGTITADAKYTYHTFTSSGTFQALEKIKGAEILLVAGGGGGGGSYGNAGAGGGGAGGVYFNSRTLNAGQYFSVTVGSGGAGGLGDSYVGSLASGNPGTNSSLGIETSAIGGGGGRSWGGDVSSGSSNGGSGGGATNGGGQSQTGGSSTQSSSYGIGYGNAGGSATASNAVKGGSGGGAGAAGTNGGDGGIGISTYNAWHVATSTGVSVSGSYYIAGGGGTAGTPGANSGGSGGGGAGASTTTKNVGATSGLSLIHI